MKKILSIIITLTLSVSMLCECFSAMAYSYVPTSGKCGVNAYWELDVYTGQLKISGSGKMINYDSFSDQPWHKLSDYIFSIKITGVSSVGDNAFSHLDYALSLSLSNSIKTIGEMSFFSDENIDSVVIPNSVESIGVNSFNSCKALTKVTLSKKIKKIPIMAFEDCQSLNTITIPKGCKEIGPSAFENCYSLKTVYYGGSKSDWKKVDKDDNDCIKSAKIVYNCEKKPSTTSITKLKGTKRGLKATWKKVNGINGYQIQIATNKKFKNNKTTLTIKNKKATSRQIKDLIGKKKYYIRVRTYKTINGNRIYSSWSKAKSVKTK